MNLLVALALLFLQPQDPPPNTAPADTANRDILAAAEKARQSIVLVKALYTTEVQPGIHVSETIKLSGIIYTAEGAILTDGNGLERAASISVVLPDGREVAAEFIAADKVTSVAVLRIKADKLTPATFAPNADIRQGVYAVAIGNPQGLKGAAAVGFVSGLGRSIQVAGRRYDELIQMTTAVQPGDCGGLVANSKGHVIGMIHSSHPSEVLDPASLGILRLFGKNTADLVPVGGASFAVPAGTLKFVADRILKHGRMVRGFAGLSIRPLDDETRRRSTLAAGEGAEIFSLEKDGPGRKAGLHRNDILVSFDGQAVTDLRALRRRVAEFDSSRAVKVVILRSGERKELELTVSVDPQP